METELKECIRLISKFKRFYINNEFEKAQKVKSIIKNKLQIQMNILDNIHLNRNECNIEKDADVSINRVNISKYLKNSLLKNGYTTINDLYNEEMDTFKELKTFGKVRLKEIELFKEWVDGKNKLFYITNI